MEPETLELAVGETKEIRVWAFPTEVKVYKVGRRKPAQCTLPWCTRDRRRALLVIQCILNYNAGRCSVPHLPRTLRFFNLRFYHGPKHVGLLRYPRQDTLIVCLTENPRPVLFPVSCVGASPRMVFEGPWDEAIASVRAALEELGKPEVWDRSVRGTTERVMALR